LFLDIRRRSKLADNWLLIDKTARSSYNHPVTSQLKVLITQDEIKQAITRIASDIRRDYKDKQPVLISILKGSFIFLADLIRQIRMPVQVEFIRVSSYGSQMKSTGVVTIMDGLKTPIKGRDVIIVEDIIDTGLTISSVVDYMKRKKPASIKICALTDKPSRRNVPVIVDYVGFTIPDKFVVGYGLDWNEQYRYLNDICVLE
jgi:hypoxanthine phosphoribosyltransferase